jgi:citronellol/citronellal dehydrogenase
MGDAAYAILTKPSKEFTGNFCIDDTVLADNGVTDFSVYADVPFDQLAPDFFVPEDNEAPKVAKES